MSLSKEAHCYRSHNKFKANDRVVPDGYTEAEMCWSDGFISGYAFKAQEDKELREELNQAIAVFKRTKRALSRLVSITVRPNDLVRDHVIQDSKEALSLANQFYTKIKGG